MSAFENINQIHPRGYTSPIRFSEIQSSAK
jgi:hypothetical protein